MGDAWGGKIIEFEMRPYASRVARPWLGLEMGEVTRYWDERGGLMVAGEDVERELDREVEEGMGMGVEGRVEGGEGNEKVEQLMRVWFEVKEEERANEGELRFDFVAMALGLNDEEGRSSSKNCSQTTQ